MTNAEIRKSMKAKRQQLSANERELAAAQATALFTKHPLFRYCKRLACYLSSRGEMDTEALLTLAAQRNKHCFLPVLPLLRPSRLWFMRYTPGDRLFANRFDILEPAPQTHRLTLPWTIDLIIVPLVAFDLAGNRLGMGAGYYDKTFSTILSHPKRPRPLLIGLAYEFQKIENLTAAAWDIPLDYAVTEQAIYRFNMQT